MSLNPLNSQPGSHVDASAIVDPTNPTNQLKINADGSINTSSAGGSAVYATQDGLAHSATPEAALAGFNSGGPVLASGLASLLDMDRLRTYMGKGSKTVTITATAAGDTSLTCVAGAMALVTPGHIVKIVTSGSNAEYVVVSPSYVPSITATSIPLVSPVVTAGRVSAVFDIFSNTGPAGGAVLPTGLLLQVPVVYDVNSGNLYAASNAGSDAQGIAGVQSVSVGLWNGGSFDRHTGYRGVADVSTGGSLTSFIVAGTSGNTIVRAQAGRLMKVIVTAVGTNAMFFYDNSSTASGNVLFVVPASSPVGSVYDLQIKTAAGITVLGNAANPGVTVTYI